MCYSMKDLKGYSFSGKLQYIWDYYKLPIFAATIAFIAAVSFLYRHFTAKETALYLASINVATGDPLTEELTKGFLLSQDEAGEKEMIYYSGLFLTEDVSDPNYQYSVASEMKLLGAIDDEKLDVVIADKKAYEAMRDQGYLYSLEELFEGEVPDEVDFSNTVNNTPLFQKAGFKEDIYTGVLVNTPRKEAAKAYIQYLFQTGMT